MKLAVVGSSSFFNKNRVFLEINEYRKERKSKGLEDVTEIVSGGASGTDKIAEQYADEYKLKKTIIPADWTDMSEPCYVKVNKAGKKYNALAGFNRNTDIVNACERLMAFWNGKSPGTNDSIEKAREQMKLEKIVRI